jgi:hypothetical protein
VDLLASRAPTADRPKRTPKWVGPAVAAGVLAAGIIGVIVFLPPSNDNRAASFPDEYATESTQQGDPTTSTTDAEPAGAVDGAASFVRLHYATAIRDPRAAWENLAPGYRPTVEEYEQFWQRYDRVKPDVLNVAPKGEGFTVDVQLTFTAGDSTTVEAYRVDVQTIAGRRQIVSSAKI